MVTVFLRGGLGNQMFQYALGVALAKKNGVPLRLDTVFLTDRFPRKNFSYRTFDLDIFTLKPHFTTLSRVASAVPVPGLWLGLDLAAIKARGALGLRRGVYERGENFDPMILAARGNLTLFGRWQSEKYFEAVATEVRHAFSFKQALEGEAKVFSEKISAVNSVSLHVRRGDYAAFQNVAQMMGDTNLSYYAAAADYIAGRAKNPEFFIFSDDIAWCKEHIKLPYPVTYVPDSAAGPKASFHLDLMSRCKHNIIANSTFSWWGAWLNANPDKIVIAPKNWYADGRKGAEDIIPDRWIKL